MCSGGGLLSSVSHGIQGQHGTLNSHAWAGKGEGTCRAGTADQSGLLQLPQGLLDHVLRGLP